MWLKVFTSKLVILSLVAAFGFGNASYLLAQSEEDSFYDSVLERAKEKSGYLYIYSRNSKILLGKIDPNTPLQLTSRDGKWQLVKLKNRRVGAWVSADFIDQSEGTARVRASNLNMRLKPSIDAQILTTLSTDYKSPILEQKNGFVKILAPTSLELAIQDTQLRVVGARQQQKARPSIEQKVNPKVESKQPLKEIYANTIDQQSHRSTSAEPVPSDQRSPETQGAKTSFAGNPKQRSATTPVLPDASTTSYVLAPGDSISLLVYGEEDLSLENARINGAGSVSLPLVGNIQVGGKTLETVEQEVTQALSQGYVRNPRVSVSIFSYRPIFIRGAITNVGAHPYSEGLTLANAIALAGGAKNSAKRNGITVQRNGQTVFEDLAKESEVLVQPGDVISIKEEVGVAEDDVYYIYLHGQVRAPGEYQFRRGLTVEKAIVLAGGFTDHASKRKITLTRYSDAVGTAEIAEPTKMKKVKLFTPVEPGDVIDVGASWL